MIHEDLMFHLISFLKMMDAGARMAREKADIPASPSGFHTFEGLVLRHGCAMPVGNKRFRRGKMGECFKNAQLLATLKNLRYCEGYAIKEGIPIPLLHAWCLDKDGYVTDPTWQPTLRQIKKGATSRRAYYGMVIDLDYVVKRMMATRMHLSVIDDFPTFPLLNERGLIKEIVRKYR